MKYRILGRTGLKVSEVGFGCWAVGGSGYGPTDDQESLTALNAAWENGVNFYDTADTYGHGHSEELLSKFFKGKSRSDFVLASKVGWDFYHGPNKKNFDPDYLRFACDESLKRLGLEYLDLCQLHNPLPEILEKGEAVGALEKLKLEGKIRFIGVSIHTQRDALAAMRDSRVDSLQLVFNLLDQRMLSNVIPKCHEQNLGIIVREPLACGLLTGKYASLDIEFDKADHRRRWTREKLALDLEKIQTIRKIFATERISLTRASLEYILNFPEISTMIPGAKTTNQVLENLQSVLDPKLRIQEAFQLKEMYQREEIFSRFF